MTTNQTTTAATSAPRDAALPPSDPRPAIARAFETAAAAIDAVEPHQLGDATGCEMTVEELLGHLIMVAQRVASAGEGTDPWTWAMETTGLAPDAWAPAFRAEIAPALDRWADDAKLERPTALVWTTVPGADVVAMYANELTIHTWDLVQATGQVVEWDPEVLAVSEAIMHEMLPMADRQPMWEATKAAMPPEVPWGGDPFANAVEVPDDAPAIDRLVAWNGRQPR